MPNAETHPSRRELTAFGLGKLDEAVANAVASHLEACSACREAVGKLPADAFRGKIRQVKSSGRSSAAGPRLTRTGGTRIASANAVATCAPPEKLPPELANHSKYRIVRELGRGGMGVVYQAVHTVMDRPIAIKVINPSVLENAEALPRFHCEVRAAAKLDHPNIVRAYDADQVGNLHLLVMEFVEGVSLADLVQQKEPLPIAYACQYMHQAAMGLQHAFEQGMVHRDIKPGNLMLTPRGQVKILDFGLARMRSERTRGAGLTQANSFMGTPEYVSPEQATDARTADIRADLYSLGCTLYFLLTGRPPFVEDTVVKLVLAQIDKEAPPLHSLRSDVSPALSAIMVRLLAKNPANRYQTPLELAQALVRFARSGGSHTAEEVSAPPLDIGSQTKATIVGAQTKKELRFDKSTSLSPTKAAAPRVEKPKEVRLATEPAKTLGWKHRAVLAGAGSCILVVVFVSVWAISLRMAKPKGGLPSAKVTVADAGQQVTAPNLEDRPKVEQQQQPKQGLGPGLPGKEEDAEKPDEENPKLENRPALQATQEQDKHKEAEAAELQQREREQEAERERKLKEENEKKGAKQKQQKEAPAASVLKLQESTLEDSQKEIEKQKIRAQNGGFPGIDAAERRFANAKVHLCELIRKYPNTKAAEEAQQLLDSTKATEEVLEHPLNP